LRFLQSGVPNSNEVRNCGSSNRARFRVLGIEKIVPSGFSREDERDKSFWREWDIEIESGTQHLSRTGDLPV
jgi:hypothetical protein